MKKWAGVVVGLVLVFGAFSVSPVQAAEEPLWKTVLSDAIEHGGFVDSTMMKEALQFAVSNGVPVSDFLSEVKAINPVAAEIAVRSCFEVVGDNDAVLKAAADSGLAMGLVVQAAIEAGVSEEEVIPAAIAMGAATKDVMAGALAGGADRTKAVKSAMAASNDMAAVADGCLSAGLTPAEVTTLLLGTGADYVQVVSTVTVISNDPVGVATAALRGGVPPEKVEKGLLAADVPEGTVAVVMGSAQRALAFTTGDGSEKTIDENLDLSGEHHRETLRIRERKRGDVSPN